MCRRKRGGKRRRSTISSNILNIDLNESSVGGRRKAVRGEVKQAIVANPTEAKRLALAKEKSPEEKEWIRTALQNSEIFGNLKDDQLDFVVDEAKAQLATKGQTVIQEGAIEETFYVVGSGEYVVTKNGKKVATYTSDDNKVAAFGELALLYNTARQATVVCTKEGWLWAVEGVAFREVMQQTGARELSARAAFLLDTPLLSNLSSAQRFGLAEKLEEVQFSSDGRIAPSVICRINDPADSLYIIRAGHVSCRRDDGTEDVRLGPGAVFGESSLEETDAVRKRDCVAVDSKVTCLRLAADVFRGQFGELEAHLDTNFKRRVVEGVKIEGTRLFDKLSVEAQEDLLEALTEVTFPSGATIIEQGQLNDTFYVIKSGVARVQQIVASVGPGRSFGSSRNLMGSQRSLLAQGGSSRNLSRNSSGGLSPQNSPRMKDVAQLQAGEAFGERALVTNEPASARVTVWKLASQKPLVCYALDRATFTSLLGSASEVASLFAELIKSREIGQRVQFNDLEIRRILGVGTFGRVKLAVHTPTQHAYALKCMRKSQILEQNMLSHVLSEKRILSMISHPFILDLVATYQDAGELYMLEELGLGGELFSVLQRHGKLSDSAARFYVASVVSTFTHLHNMKVIYRDLKPENLLLDKNGYLLLVDFGMAKLLDQGERTWTVCGTPEYMAPEVVKHKFGYSFSADWWCVGIFAYECFTTTTPFAADDPMTIYRRILKGEIGKWPKGLQSYETLGRDFIESLLTLDATVRLGGKLGDTGSRQVRGHPWFHEEKVDNAFTWAALEQKSVKPPFVPRIKNALDMRNFDNYGKDDGQREYPNEFPNDRTTFAEWGTDWI